MNVNDLDPRPVGATTFTRCHHAELMHPMGGMPTALFDWQTVTTLDSGTVHTADVGRTQIAVDDPDAIVALVDPQTLQPTGEAMTRAQCYAVVVSLAVESLRLSASAG